MAGRRCSWDLPAERIQRSLCSGAAGIPALLPPDAYFERNAPPVVRRASKAVKEKDTMSEAIHADRHLDAKGMLCPMPVISVKRAIKDLQRGQILSITATDKGACRDIPAWAEQTGHKLLTQTEENKSYTFYIEKAGWDDELEG